MLNLNSLNPQQRQAVETIQGPLLILAGAGTGKTRVITFRIAHLIERGVPPENILAVTFTNKAAREMQERVNQLIPRRRSSPKTEKPPRPTLCTFHSLCVRILRKFIDRLGYKHNFVIYDESEQLAALKKVLSHFSAGAQKIDPKPILSAISRIKNSGAASLTHFDPDILALAERLKPRYDSALRACNAVDFDDLILLALQLFSQHPDVLQACRSHYQFVMVDEYQDTNSAQFDLVYSLTREHRNFCVVGDDDQSIYGWRGAEIANLLNLEKFFPEIRIVKLEQNYRSNNTILQAANALIKNNARRRPKQLWSQKGQGSLITLHTFPSEVEEAHTIVEEIEFQRKIKKIPWSAQAVLFRTNIQSRPIETALRKASVRYHLIGGQSFFDRREIKDFLAYLKLLLHPDDDISLLRVANVPARGLSDVTMERLLAASQERKCSVFAAMTNPVVEMSFLAPARNSIKKFVEFVHSTSAPLKSNPQLSLVRWAQDFLSAIGYFDELRRSEKEPEAADNRIRSLNDLLGILDNDDFAGATPSERLHSFLTDLALDNDRAEKEPEGDAVTLITIHSCKGLEFPNVYIVGLEEGLLPHSRSKVEGTLDEERRLFYVAMTRAMNSLTLSHCISRVKFGQKIECHPSTFLRELPTELIESGSQKGKEPVSVNSGKDFFNLIRANLNIL